MSANLPTGSIVLYPFFNVSTGLQEIEAKTWMLCDGRSIRKSAYPDLYRVIGNKYGGHNEFFDIPDYRNLAIHAPASQPNAPLAYYMIKCN